MKDVQLKDKSSVEKAKRVINTLNIICQYDIIFPLPNFLNYYFKQKCYCPFISYCDVLHRHTYPDSGIQIPIFVLQNGDDPYLCKAW